MLVCLLLCQVTLMERDNYVMRYVSHGPNLRLGTAHCVAFGLDLHRNYLVDIDGQHIYPVRSVTA